MNTKEVGGEEENMLTFKMNMFARCRQEWRARKGIEPDGFGLGWLVFVSGQRKRTFDSLELE